MSEEINVAGLVLTSAVGWAELGFGALPVRVLRRHSREPLVLAGGWVVSAVLVPSAVFHWYVIFAIFCFLSWTKIDRLGGKIWLAIGAALSLSLGLIFPLHLSPALLAREHPLALASLYLGGGATGLAYVVFATSGAAPLEKWRPTGLAKNLTLLAVAWMALLAARPWLEEHFASIPRQEFSSDAATFAAGGSEFGLGILLILLSALAFNAARRVAPFQARTFALGATAVAAAQALLTQLVFR